MQVRKDILFLSCVYVIIMIGKTESLHPKFLRVLVKLLTLIHCLNSEQVVFLNKKFILWETLIQFLIVNKIFAVLL